MSMEWGIGTKIINRKMRSLKSSNESQISILLKDCFVLNLSTNAIYQIDSL